MSRRARSDLPCLTAAILGASLLGWLGLYSFAWNDYETEAAPSFDALAHGQILAFLRLAPAYGGSLVERAPFALIPDLFSGGPLAIYRSVAAPCLLASVLLCVWLVARMRALDRPRLSRLAAGGLIAASPISLIALELGHPEEILGGALVVAAVILAARDRAVWTAIALGLAIANKEWALIAVGPVLIALPARRMTCMLIAAAVAGVVLAPLALASSGGFVSTARATASTSSTIFQPWQWWWFIGHHGAAVHGLFGELKPGYRTAPAWIGAISHPLIIAAAVPLTLLAWVRRCGRPLLDALGLLCLLALLRCALDTWDVAYYTVPFLFALTTWEAHRNARPPVLALVSTILIWATFEWLPGKASADLQSAFFDAWTIPLGIALAVRLYAPGWHPVSRWLPHRQRRSESAVPIAGL